MNGELPNIIGNQTSINSNYKILQDLNKSIDVDKLFQNFIHKDRKVINIEYDIKENQILLWFLRRYEKSSEFVFNLSSIDSNLFLKSKHEQEIILLDEILILI